MIFALTECAQCICEANLMTLVVLRKHLIEKQLCVDKYMDKHKDTLLLGQNERDFSELAGLKKQVY